MIPKQFDLKTYDYQVPLELIAQEPWSKRDECRLLIIDRAKQTLDQGLFKDLINYFSSDDVLVLNNTKVIKAKLVGRKPGAGKIEVLLIKEVSPGIWECLVKPGKRARVNETIEFDSFTVKIKEKTESGGRLIEFPESDVHKLLEKEGKAPLPPYIKKDVDDPNKYQTVYAQIQGAIAAPTAGMHFTDQLLTALIDKGVKIATVTLHCGLATFRPIKVEDIRNHPMDTEWIEVSQDTADLINQAKTNKKQVIACGTTAIRSLETAAYESSPGVFKVKAYNGLTDKYITPGYQFKIVDRVITNFHTPCSTNIVLLSSFYGIDLLRKSYDYAVANKFRFYSFGDATIVL